MYDELVKRLRENSASALQNCDFDFVHAWMLEAADAIEELQEYKKAEVEERLIILPVKEGTPLYVDGKIFAAHCKGKIHEVKDWYYSLPMIYKDFRGEHDYVIDPDRIGDSVFLTRKEAEKNLMKEE